MDKKNIPADIEKDAATVKALVEKYGACADALPGTLGSALGGLRTALRGLEGHVANSKAAPPATAKN